MLKPRNKLSYHERPEHINETHHDNTPIQIYRKFHIQKPENFQDIFQISAKNKDCGYSLEPPRQSGSNEYPHSVFGQK